MSQVDRTPQYDSLFPSSITESNLTKPAGQLERTADNVLAKLGYVGSNKDKLKVEALFKVVQETPDQGNTLRLRLWRLWGDGEIATGTILASCEYEPDTFEASEHRIFFAYQALNSHRIHALSYVTKVHIIDPTTLKHETHSSSRETNALVPPQVKLFQDLLQNLAPGHALLMRVRLENNKPVIDPEQVMVARSLSTPVSVGFGPFPEEGSRWGLVGKVTPEGQLEMTAEYKVLKSRTTSAKNSWKAQFEKTSIDRRLFSLIDLKHT